MSKPRVAVVGCGYWGQNLIRNFAELKEAELKVVCDFDLGALAEDSKDFSGAEIEEAINSALYDAYYAKEALKNEHVATALAQTVPLAKTMDEQISRLRSWAEGRARNASLARNGSVTH